MNKEFRIMTKEVDCGVLAEMSSSEFVDRYIPKRIAGLVVRATDFLKGRSHSEAIEAGLASREDGAPIVLVLDKQNWIIDRAIMALSQNEWVTLKKIKTTGLKLITIGII